MLPNESFFMGTTFLYIDFDGFYLFIIFLLCHMGYEQIHKEHNRKLSDASFSVGTNLQGELYFFSPFVMYHSLHNLIKVFCFIQFHLIP